MRSEKQTGNNPRRAGAGYTGRRSFRNPADPGRRLREQAFPDPVEAIKFRMEQGGLTPKDLQPMIGRLNRVYEVLNHKRPLTLGMIRKLHKGLGIPAESLIKTPTGA